MNAQGPDMKPRWRKVLADLWDSKSRTMLVVASIAVGVFAVGAISTAFVIMAEDIDVSYITANPANVDISTDYFDDDLLGSIERLPDVADAEGRAFVPVRVSSDGQVWQSLNLIGVDKFDDSGINQLDLLEGVASAGPGEVLITYFRMNDTGYEPGDVLQVRLPDDSLREVVVTGLVADQSLAGDFASPARGYVLLDTLYEMGLPDQYNRLYLTVEGDRGDPDNIDMVAAAAEDQLERSDRFVYSTTTTETDSHPMGSTVLALLGVLGALGLLVTLLSGSLIFNTLNALLTQHFRQIGVMKLVGARSRQISGMYQALIVAYGLVALAISVPTGMLAGYGLAAFIGDYMGAELQGFRVVPLAVILQVIVALVVPLAAGYFPVSRGAKIKVRRAISADGMAGSGAPSSGSGRFSALVSWMSRPLILSVRNTFRRKGRLALTLFTLTIAGAIFIAVFNVRASLAQFMDEIAMHFMADITVSFDRPYRVNKVEEAALQIPGVERVEGWQVGLADVMDQSGAAETPLYLFAPPHGSELVNPDLLAGRWLQPGDRQGIVLADSIWVDYPDLQPGDTLPISVQGGRTEYWDVLGIFRFTDMVGIQFAYTDYDTLAHELDLPGQASSYRLVTSAKTMEAQQALSATVDEQLRASGYDISDIEAGMVTQQQNSQAINILVIFLLLMALLTAFVGSIGLAGTMGMNVLERTREIGVMRAIGAVDLDIIKTVVVEGAVIGLISWVLAVILSFPISYLLLYIVGDAMINAVMPIALTPWGAVLWLGVVLALSVVASMVPARSAARLTIREVLAYE